MEPSRPPKTGLSCAKTGSSGPRRTLMLNTRVAMGARAALREEGARPALCAAHALRLRLLLLPELPLPPPRIQLLYLADASLPPSWRTPARARPPLFQRLHPGGGPPGAPPCPALGRVAEGGLLGWLADWQAAGGAESAPSCQAGRHPPLPSLRHPSAGQRLLPFGPAVRLLRLPGRPPLGEGRPLGSSSSSSARSRFPRALPRLLGEIAGSRWLEFSFALFRHGAPLFGF